MPAPSTPFGTLLKELTRRGQVQVLDGEIVRFKRATVQRGGMTPAFLSESMDLGITRRGYANGFSGNSQ
jgi:hypothetical protein